MSNIKTDRREHLRAESVLPLHISKKGLTLVAETRNISCAGLYCRVTRAIPLMSKIGLTLLLPNHRGQRVLTEKIKCKGVVVRSEPVILQETATPHQNIAIFFTDLSNKDKNKIAEYVITSFQK